MEARLQRRVQRYGWDKAVVAYESGWSAQLAPAQSRMLDLANPGPGDRALDVACGTGLVTFRLAEAVGPAGVVVGTDISGEMVEAARRTAWLRGAEQVSFERCDAEALPFADGVFNLAVCALGLMYVPDPVHALRRIHRAVKPGGRVAAAVWGARGRCGWAEIFPITDARVASEVCPMFFHLGTGDMLAHAFAEAGFEDIRAERLTTTLAYGSPEEALTAAFRGGPVALAYSRFDAQTTAAVHADYLASIASYKSGSGYRIPGEFVVASAVRGAPPA